ncbi:hydantoinase/oxoprolinase N-terminal domain-containing protein [Haladaptatus pallidirubidus]|uniref:hydantoinase/oxoprolinase N-terminal domain-containing protein n=1 Tax=Haladaptatus pallidirubidus TaxID=1008152 RepID=UPI0035E7EF85
MGYLCNVDTGGTHTDTVVIDENGHVTEAKAPSTPDDFARGFFDSLEVAAKKKSSLCKIYLQRANSFLMGRL